MPPACMGLPEASGGLAKGDPIWFTSRESLLASNAVDGLLGPLGDAFAAALALLGEGGLGSARTALFCAIPPNEMCFLPPLFGDDDPPDGDIRSADWVELMVSSRLSVSIDISGPGPFLSTPPFSPGGGGGFPGFPGGAFGGCLEGVSGTGTACGDWAIGESEDFFRCAAQSPKEPCILWRVMPPSGDSGAGPGP